MRTALVAIALFIASCSPQIPEYPEVSVRGQDAVVPIKELSPGVPRFFGYGHGKASVSFFVVLLEEEVESYFNACETCHAKKRGYELRGERIVCKACGESYLVEELKQGVGSCYPVRLEGRAEGGEYLIPLEALRAKAYMF